VFQRINNVLRYTGVVSGANNCNCSVGRVGCGAARKIAVRKIEMEEANGFGIVRDRDVNMISQPLMTLRVQIRAGL
jgi:hypothetical protein